MHSPILTLAAIGIVMCLAPNTIVADEVSTPGFVVRFEGAENKSCPTGTGMFTLLGSRAVLTLPQLPPVPKHDAIPADIDSVLFGNSILFRASGLPDHSGKLFEFIGKTRTVEVTIRYR